MYFLAIVINKFYLINNTNQFLRFAYKLFMCMFDLNLLVELYKPCCLGLEYTDCIPCRRVSPPFPKCVWGEVVC